MVWMRNVRHLDRWWSCLKRFLELWWQEGLLDQACHWDELWDVTALLLRLPVHSLFPVFGWELDMWSLSFLLWPLPPCHPYHYRLLVLGTVSQNKLFLKLLLVIEFYYSNRKELIHPPKWPPGFLLLPLCPAHLKAHMVTTFAVWVLLLWHYLGLLLQSTLCVPALALNLHLHRPS